MAYKFPGVFATINDQSGITADYTTNSVGYVGESEYGPVFKPTLCTSLQDYVNKFGKLNSTYGYAGYSLAVAAETINQHYFVRVVNTGEAGLHTDKDAKWGAATVLNNESTSEAPTSTGYYYEEITAAEQARDAGNESGLFEDTDLNSAFMIVATNPNNRKFYINIADSTINENRAYAVSAPTVLVPSNDEDEPGYEGMTKVIVTVPCQFNPDGTYGFGGEFKDASIGDKIVISKMLNDTLNGVFTIDGIEIVEEEQIAKITYMVKGEQTLPENGDANARIGMYPDADNTTFSVTVSEKIGRVITTLETYEYCTLYPAQDQYGNSTFIEDVINGTSEYIQVFFNKNYEQDAAWADKIVIPQNVTAVPVEGGYSGTFKGETSEQYKKLCEAWELFRDPSQVAVNLLVNSGYVSKENTSYQAKMLEIAEARRDCFCLFDVPMDQTDYEKVIDWRKNINGMNTYRAALSSPWVKTYDSVQGRANFIMCPSAYVAKIMGAYDPWKAPAGLNRGIIGSSTVSPTGLTQYYNDVEGGNLYTDNQINCIIRNSGTGYVNWGQRTLQQRPSALDRINVARTVIYIETVLREAARFHVFENNTSYEREQITLQFSAFLDQVLSSEGIQAYTVQCDANNNPPQVIANNQLKIDIKLLPTYCAEFIIIQSTIENGVTTTSVSTGA